MGKSINKFKINALVLTIILSLILALGFKVNIATKASKVENFIVIFVHTSSKDVSIQDLSRGFVYETLRGWFFTLDDLRTHNKQGNPVNSLLFVLPIILIIISIIEKNKSLKSRIMLADFKILISTIYLTMLGALILGIKRYMKLAPAAYFMLIISIILLRTCYVHSKILKRKLQIEESENQDTTIDSVLSENDIDDTVESNTSCN